MSSVAVPPESGLGTQDETTSEHIERWETPELESGQGVNHGSPGVSIRELEALQKQAYEEAYAVGIEEGFKAGEQKSLAQTKRLAALFQQLDQPFETLDESVEKQVVQLSLVIARHIIRRELKTEPAHVIGAVREALLILPVAARNVRVKLHPQDAELVRKYLQPPEGERAWNIEEDPVLTRGGCRIDTEYSHVDARIESRLSALIATMFGDERESPDSRKGDSPLGPSDRDAHG